MNEIKKFPWILLGLLAWFIIFSFGKSEILWDLGSTSIFEQAKAESTNSNLVTEILKKLENNKIDEAISEINRISSEDFPESVREYLGEFVSYYNSDKKQRDITALMNGMTIIKNYYISEGFTEVDSIGRAEVIPFFCIKNFELSVRKPKELNLICDIYLNNTVKNHVSHKTASIICLKIRSYYKMEGLGKTDDYIKDIQEMITGYQEKFPSELGLENPTYVEESAYLKRFNGLCENIRNKHVFDKWDRLTFNMKIAGLGE